MDSNPCLLDTNIVMDEILERARLGYIKSNIFNKYDAFFITAKTFSTAFYLLRKQGWSKDKIFNRLKKYKIIAITETICYTGYNWAEKSDDVEDSMELVTAYLNDLTFITADRELLQKYGEKTEIELVEG